MISIPGQPLAMTFFDASDNPIADGYITLRLNQDALSSNRQVLAGITIKIDLDGSGSFSSEAVIPNDTMNPNNTVYFAKVYTAAGQPIWDEQLYVTTP
jgi:hypothetical protein